MRSKDTARIWQACGDLGHPDLYPADRAAYDLILQALLKRAVTNLDRAKAALHLRNVVAMWFAIVSAKVDIRKDIPHLENARALCNR